MLVLSRKRNEKIIIEAPGYPPVEIVVVEIRGDKVRIGVQADKQINVNREEIYKLGLHRDEAQAIKAAKQATLVSTIRPVDSTLAKFIQERAS